MINSNDQKSSNRFCSSTLNGIDFQKRCSDSSTKHEGSSNLSYEVLPSGFFHGLSLQLPFLKKQKDKRSYPAITFLNNSRQSSVNNEDDKWENIELVEFSRQIIVDSGDETGIGHEFSAVKFRNPTWCDRCGDSIWGLTKLFLRCENCNYTCHQNCQDLVTLDCKVLVDQDEKFEDISSDDDYSNSSIDSKQNDKTLILDKSSNQQEDLQNDTSNDEIEKNCSLLEQLEEYNKKQAQGLHMTMYDDGNTFRGFIRVHMNLSRPINVVAGTRPPSIYDIIFDEEETMRKTLTSFYLPRDTVKALHITSLTTTQEVIISLLKKFKVVDNPRKYALYERFLDPETEEIKLRRLQDHEQPLMMALMWGTNGIESRSFILQENETGDILWDEFSMPELNNFLKILDLEEEEYLNQVKIKYKTIHDKIQEMLKISKPLA